ncbi:hypothetical protein R3I94_007908 [Phoxinus phoxinus]|uniref:Uncharacterized protein n=1 Tax=Phoxinus phoxinus TaxID=58324 RepID=A0AAN9H9S2_9TELE
MREFSSSQHNNITSAEKKGMELSLMAAQHFPAVSGALMDTPHNGNASLQTSTSNLNPKPVDPKDEPKYSSDTIWLWVAVIATVSNIVVVAVVCACAF